MNKLITTTAMALLIATPAFAQSDTDPATASINDENRARMNTDDLRMDRFDGDFVVLRDRQGRRFRMPRTFFMDDMNDGDTDPGTASINDENRDRMNTDDLTNN